MGTTQPSRMGVVTQQMRMAGLIRMVVQMRMVVLLNHTKTAWWTRRVAEVVA
jgi:hypothetical protein